jgi:flagellar motor switch protein FliN
MAMSSVNSVKVEIAVVLGSSVIPINQLLRMGRGAVIELDSHQDDRIAVSISEILKGTSQVQHSR